ncbi:MAG: potassium channel family protein [Chloroflexota bacterium]
MPYSQLISTQSRKRRSFRRYTVAVLRDYWALWHEFKRPIVYFLLATVGVGILYGELHAVAYPDEVVALIDRPYMMLQLMILESPDLTVPWEPHLIVFWYVLPVFFVYIVASGAADFVRLFFSRDERQDAWMEALASTYRNHVIVFGAGHVGMRVIIELSQMGYDVVVIDNEPDDGVDEALDKLRVPLILGDGRTSAILEKAGLPYAVSFVVCTGNDHTNLEAVMKARDMNPEVRIVARMWDDQFASQIKQFMNVQTVLSSSSLAAPAFAGAALGIEITQTLNVGGVEYSMLRITVAERSFMDGVTVGELQKSENMDIVLHGNGTGVDVQPSRDTVVNAGDTLVIFATHSRILTVVARNRSTKRRLFSNRN